MFSNMKLIDDLSNIKNSKFYIFGSKKDTIIRQEVVIKNAEIYKTLNPNVKSVFEIETEHCFPTELTGHGCKKLVSPYISSCNYNGAFESLSHILKGIRQSKKRS